jgi:dimethylamine/trimethylamine dehydrogenase
MFMPMRCTQNPTKGEEWRRGWHPERIEPKGSEASVLIVGAGPAGLECARALGQRGYAVTLAEADTELGGHLNRVSPLPGLASWARVRDYRTGQIQNMTNVEVFLDSRLDAAQVREFGFNHVVIATGSSWRGDGMGRAHQKPIPGADQAHVVVPDQVIAGIELEGPVVVYDDDHYFMASVLAEKLSGSGLEVHYVTPAPDVANWTHNTMEQSRIQARLLELGVEVHTSRLLATIGPDDVELACAYTGRTSNLDAGAVVLVTMRLPDDGLYHELMNDGAALEAAGIKSVTRIGDCLAPGLIAAAVYAGHKYARELDADLPSPDDVPFRRETMQLSNDWPVL